VAEQDFSYDVYIKVGEDWAGHDQRSDAIAHFHEEDNAVAFKRQLEGQGETVYVERSTLQGFSEVAKEAWFEDYEAGW